MMVDFYESFGKDTDVGKEIPAEILELLNQDLPDNFIFVKDTNGQYMAVPRADKSILELRLTTQFDLDEGKDATLIERLKTLPREKWPEYFYRIQRAIPIKNLKIGDKKNVVPIEKTIGNPLEENKFIIAESKMYPEHFPEPAVIVFESLQGDRLPIKIQQQAYDSLTEIKFENVDFPALKIEIYCYAPLVENLAYEEPVTNAEAPFRLTYSVTPSNAQTVAEAIVAINIFKGLLDGTVKINGQIIMSKDKQSTSNSEKIDDILVFWTTVLQLEEKLGVSFDPHADFPAEDMTLFAELKSCLIDKNEITWKHPFTHFHIGEYRSVDKEYQFEDLIGKEGISYKFIEGPIQAVLLSAEFDLYSYTVMKDFVITNIEWDDANKKSGEVYITDAPGKVWTLSRLYITEKEHYV